MNVSVPTLSLFQCVDALFVAGELAMTESSVDEASAWFRAEGEWWIGAGGGVSGLVGEGQ